MTILLVCGGRSYSNRARLFQVLDALSPPPSVVVAGGATGADTFAAQWAGEREIPCYVVPADWKRYGRSAGPKRNQRMLEDYLPNLVVAFPGGRGTAHMVSIARKAGIEVREVE